MVGWDWVQVENTPSMIFFRVLSGFKLNNHSEKEFYLWIVEKDSKWGIKYFHLTFCPKHRVLIAAEISYE